MADVDISDSQVTLDGSCKIVVAGSQFVWLRLLTDKKWISSFQQSLLEGWRSQNSLDGKPPQSTKTRKPTSTVAGNAVVSDEMTLRTIGDVVIKKWCCTRTHQVLTRLFLTAEKHERKADNLLFTSSEECEFRRNKRERSVLLEQICVKKLEEAGSSLLRDWLNRIWVLFVTGIDNDPSGQRALSYDVRKAVHDAQFTNEDAIIVQASLLSLLVSSLKYEKCQAIAETDFRVAPLIKPTELTGFEASQRRTTPAQLQFTHVFISFVGSFLDTLTETEVVKVASVFKPAIRDAQQRILKRPKPVLRSGKKTESFFVATEDVIQGDNLDKVSCRKHDQKVA